MPRTPLELFATDTLIDDESREIQQTVRRLVADRIAPEIADWYESGEVPVRDVARELGALGVRVLASTSRADYTSESTDAVLLGVARDLASTSSTSVDLDGLDQRAYLSTSSEGRGSVTWPWSSDLRPLSARSVALSMLLGAHAPSMSAAELTGLGERFGINPATTRVALSRMVGSGDLLLTDGSYSLSVRHLSRQAATEQLIHPRVRPYDGRWRMVIVVERGRSLERRTALRAGLRGQRFGELREGTWLRPDNLDGLRLEPADLEQARTFTTLPDDDRDLCRELWDLDGWAGYAEHLLGALRTSPDPMQRLAAAAAAVRHLCTDPVLPVELAPARWPASELRDVYEDYRADLAATLSARPTTPERAARPVAVAPPGAPSHSR